MRTQECPSLPRVRDTECQLRLDARAPLWVLTMGAALPDHPELLCANGTYLVFDSMTAATRWACESSFELYTRAPFDWRLTGLSPSDTEHTALFNLLQKVCQVHAVLSDPEFQSYSNYYPARPFYQNRRHMWPIVVSTDALIDLSSDIDCMAINARTSEKALDNGDSQRLDNLCDAIYDIYRRYWQLMLSTNAPLTACQRASDAVWCLLKYNLDCERSKKHE